MNSRLILIAAYITASIMAVVIGSAVAEQSYRMLYILLLIACLITSIISPKFLTLLTVFAFASGLTLPQLEGKMNLFYVCAASLAGVAILRLSMDRKTPIIWSKAHAWLVIFALVVLMTLLIRGAGLRILGDEKWGGMFYVQLFISMSMVFVIPRVSLSKRMWRPVLVAAALAPFLPVLSGFLASVGSSTLMTFVQTDTQSEGQIAQLAAGSNVQVERYFALGYAGQSAYNILFYFLSIQSIFGRGLVISIPFGIGVLILVGLSGFRSSMLNIGLFTALMLKVNRAISFGRILIFTLLVIGFYVFAFLFAQSLPPPIQRMLSILPGISVSSHISSDAESTTEWRIELWKRGLQFIPDYWLVGKGYAFSSREMLAATNPKTGLFDPTDWAVMQCAYHQGLLSLLLGLGIPGLISGILMYYLFVRRHLQLQKMHWCDPVLHRCHQVLTVNILTSFIIFVVLYGDVQSSFPTLFYYIALLEGLWATNIKLTGDADGLKIVG
jgi:O-Antigen ligase